MSLESNLKSSAESLKSIAGSLVILTELLAKQQPQLMPDTQPTAPPPAAEPEATPPAPPAPPAPSKPLPKFDEPTAPVTLAEANNVLVSAATHLGDNGDSVRKIMAAYEVKGLSELVDQPAKMSALVNDVKALILETASR